MIPAEMSVPPTPKRVKMEEEKMDFEDPDEQRHDCVLVVKEKKFYCVKATLAKHATFFEKQFFARNSDKKKKEYKLVDPESPEGFQAFLEVIHGVKSLSDENIKEVLSLASRWTAGVAKNRCMEFLSSDQCQMDLKAKFQMACELELVEYLEFLLEGITDVKTIDPLITEEVMVLNQPIIGVIFKKFFELTRQPDVIVERVAQARAIPAVRAPEPVRIPEPVRAPPPFRALRVPPMAALQQERRVPPALGGFPVMRMADVIGPAEIRRRMRNRESPPYQSDESESEDEPERPRRRANRFRRPEAGVVLGPRRRFSPVRYGHN